MLVFTVDVAKQILTYYHSNNTLLEIDIKNCTCYSFNDIINIHDFNPKNIKVDTKLYKNILIFYIGCETLDV